MSNIFCLNRVQHSTSLTTLHEELLMDPEMMSRLFIHFENMAAEQRTSLEMF